MVQRRTDALSRERIVEAATDILDAEGERALTVKALTTRLRTGYGAIYHHVANKDDLLAAATDDVVAQVVAELAEAAPRAMLRALALGLFDAIDAHPWVGTQLARDPRRPTLIDVYETVGAQLDALGVPDDVRFDAAGTLVNYVLGVAGQNAARAREDAARSEALSAIATSWEQLDPERYPFVRRAATQLRDHDDRDQFLAGIDLILAGIATVVPDDDIARPE